MQVILWSQGVKEGVACGGGWGQGEEPLLLSSAVTAVDFAPHTLHDKW